VLGVVAGESEEEAGAAGGAGGADGESALEEEAGAAGGVGGADGESASESTTGGSRSARRAPENIPGCAAAKATTAARSTPSESSTRRVRRAMALSLFFSLSLCVCWWRRGGEGRGFNKEMIVYHEEKKKTSRNCHLFSFTYSA
jgi:ferric-dicitrate binding protein FerR (iron transport regulator)